MPAYFTNANGSIRAFTQAEIDEIEIETLGIEDGSSPRKTRRVGGSTEEYEFLIKAALFDRFCAYMLGAAKIYDPDDPGTGESEKISRLLPQSPPDLPKFIFVEVTDTSGHKFEVDDNDSTDYPSPTYERMKVKLLAQHIMFDASRLDNTGAEYLRYVQTLPSQVETSYLNLQGGSMTYYKNGGGGPTGKAIPYGIGFPVPESIITRKWWRVPIEGWGEGTPLFDRVHGDVETGAGTKPYLNSLNSVALFGYQPGYLQFLGVEEELAQDPLGDDLCWNLTLKWKASHLAPHTWKYYFSTVAADAANNGWYFTAKSNATYYPTATLPDDTALFNVRDHRLLFQVGE